MSQMESLYQVLRPLATQPECQSCRLCEEHVGLVYLLGDEAVKANEHSLPIITSSQGVQYLSRTRDGWCSSFDPNTNMCRMYADRPLCCRLYPLDLMQLEGAVWWVIHAECPIAQRFQKERRLAVLAAITDALERALSKEQLNRWLIQDKMSRGIESFSY